MAISVFDPSWETASGFRSVFPNPRTSFKSDNIRLIVLCCLLVWFFLIVFVFFAFVSLQIQFLSKELLSGSPVPDAPSPTPAGEQAGGHNQGDFICGECLPHFPCYHLAISCNQPSTCALYFAPAFFLYSPTLHSFEFQTFSCLPFSSPLLSFLKQQTLNPALNVSHRTFRCRCALSDVTFVVSQNLTALGFTMRCSFWVEAACSGFQVFVSAFQAQAGARRFRAFNG